MFSKELIDYTVSTFKESKIDILTGTMVKEIKDKSVVLQMPDKSIKEVPVGMVVWAGGNKARDVSVNLMSRLSDAQKNKRGITVDGIAASHFRKLLSDSFPRQTTFAWRVQTGLSLLLATAPLHSMRLQPKLPPSKGYILLAYLNKLQSAMPSWSRFQLLSRKARALRV